MNAHGPASDGDLTWILISRFAPIMHPQRVRFAAQNDSAMRPLVFRKFRATRVAVYVLKLPFLYNFTLLFLIIFRLPFY